MSQGPSNASDPSKVSNTESRPFPTDEFDKALMEGGEQLRAFIRETKPITEEENLLVRKAAKFATAERNGEQPRLPPELRITL